MCHSNNNNSRRHPRSITMPTMDREAVVVETAAEVIEVRVHTIITVVMITIKE
jgi:hypothetical protein